MCSKKKKMKFLGSKSNKTCPVLYAENYKMVMKIVNKDLNNWRDIVCLWIGGLNIEKISILLKLIYK